MSVSPLPELAPFDALLAEQEAAQRDKFQGRLLSAYNQNIFRGQDFLEPQACAISDFVRPLCSGGVVSLEGMLDGLHGVNGRPVRWVDMGGGRALPMRQLASVPGMRGKLDMTSVDLFDVGLEGLDAGEIEYIESLHPGATADKAKPRIIRADVAAVILPESADVITCLNTVQYLDDPLAAVSCWYNQLAGNGLLIIAGESEWASRMHYQRLSGWVTRDESPTKDLLESLRAAGIAHGASLDHDWPMGRPRLDPSCFRNLIIQKMPGTRMVANTNVMDVWSSPQDYKVVTYEKSAQPLIGIES